MRIPNVSQGWFLSLQILYLQTNKNKCKILILEKDKKERKEISKQMNSKAEVKRT